MARTLRGRGFRQLSFGATSCPGYCERSYKLRVLRGYISARRSRQHLRMAKSTQASAIGEQLKLCPVSVSEPGRAFDNKPPRWLRPAPSAAHVRRIQTRVARRNRLSNVVWPRYGSAPHHGTASVSGVGAARNATQLLRGVLHENSSHRNRFRRDRIALRIVCACRQLFRSDRRVPATDPRDSESRALCTP